MDANWSLYLLSGQLAALYSRFIERRSPGRHIAFCGLFPWLGYHTEWWALQPPSMEMTQIQQWGFLTHKLWGANSVVLVHKQIEIFPHIGTGSQKITYFKFVIKCFYYLLLTYWTAAPLVLTLLIIDVFCYPLFYVMSVQCMCNRR